MSQQGQGQGQHQDQDREAAKVNGGDQGDQGGMHSHSGGHSDEGDEPSQVAAKRTAKHDSGVADLEKVTDYAEEKEVNSQDIMGALSIIRDQQNKATAAKIEKEKELMKVHISKEDVDLIVNEMEINRATAERTLRKHNGDVVAALTALTD